MRTLGISGRESWPAWAGLYFFVVYQWLMAGLLYSGRDMPPAADSFYYVFRIGRVLDGAWINDSSILFTYFMAGLGRIFGRDAMGAFTLGAIVGPPIIAVVLWKLFKSLKFSAGLTGLSFFLLAFYCNIGPHTFLHFVPSTLAVTLSLLWLALVARPDRHTAFLAGFLVNGLLILAHSSGVYVVFVNLCLWIAIQLYRGNRDILAQIAWTCGAVIVMMAALRWLPFHDLLYPFDQLRWIRGEEAGKFLDAGGAAGYSFTPGEFLTSEAKLAPYELWMQRLYSYFFIFLFPSKKLALLVVPLMGALMFNSLRKKSSLVRNPYLWFFFAVYLALFFGLSYSHERGARFVEYAWPLAFILLAVMLYDIPNRWLRTGGVLGCAVYLGFISYNFSLTESLKDRNLLRMKPEVRDQIKTGVVFYADNGSASYLLANGIPAQNLYLLPFFKRRNDTYYLASLANCPTEEPQNVVRRVFRKLSPPRPHPAFIGPNLSYAAQVNVRYDPWWGTVKDCFYIQKIVFLKPDDERAN